MRTVLQAGCRDRQEFSDQSRLWREPGRDIGCCQDLTGPVPQRGIGRPPSA